ncbi:two component transcriptional regulator, LytTR family [Filimonas lacunae]|uniref:Two component transcriptional regulator, LytTR family n=1 Tax=Filimonas lacunae TaxID=477680 RepID=A0A173MKQ4_9BACT|nr:LytTR family transcriptional regulator DNA-binding domain-containing protein [Filimonas lacunae]BAV08057.1 two-component system response regulator [Filimonas lacunae]SIT08674.1 two component transcriptional regulator, LytTR family [Filimonas lacunae]
MIKALVIDDEPLARSIVKEYLQAWPEFTIAQECGDGFEGIKAITAHTPDIIFLDIQMPKINGFEMLELVEKAPAIIFTTAFDEYAIKAFETHAVDYLLKPFSQERFDKAIQKWLNTRANAANTPAVNTSADNTQALLDTAAQGPANQHRVVVKEGSKIKIIPVPSIQYIEAADDYVKIHTADGCYLKNKTMAHFEQLLGVQQFVRIHRSYIINIQLITRIDPYEKDSHLVILQTGMRLPVSKSGYSRLKEVLGL